MSKESRKVKATYLGRRLLTGGRFGHVWKIDDQEQHSIFAKQIAPAKVGERWILTYSDKMVTVSGEGKPVEIGMHADKKQVSSWAAAEVASLQSRDEQKFNKKMAKRKTEFELTLEPLRAMSESLNHSERSLFIQRVVSELWRR